MAGGEGKKCCGFREETCDGLWRAVGVTFVILCLVILIVSLVRQVRRDDLHRTCGVAGGAYRFRINFDSDKPSVYFRILYNVSAASAPVSIYMRGPTVLGTDTGPIRAILCGAPGAIACDTATSPGRVEDTIELTIQDGSASQGVDLRTVIEPYRREPELYYLEILNTTTTVVAREWLTNMCGYA